MICGALENGKDGVGDYCLRIGTEMSNLGFKTSILAINDPFIKLIDINRNNIIPTLRIPSLSSNKDRFNEAHNFITWFTPDWISIQFVPFAYQAKGLPINFIKNIKKIVGNIKIHIMFHELWIGMERNASLRKTIWGVLQKILIMVLIKKLKPKIIHTHASIYLNHIINLGFNAQQLPLIGNIPPNIKDNKRIKNCNKAALNLIIFGTIHHGAPVQNFVKELKQYAQTKKVPTHLTFMGKNGIEYNYWKKVFENHNIPVKNLGILPTKEISDELRKANIGITTTPYLLVEKSGTVAAMQEHNLKVICVAKSWDPKSKFNVNSPKGIQLYQKGNLTSCIDLNNRFNKYNIKDIAALFADSLKE